MERTLQEIAERLGGELVGDGRVVIRGLCGIQDAKAGDLSFVASARYARHAEGTGASALLVHRGFEVGKVPVIRVDDPEQALESLIDWYRPASRRPDGRIDPRALVDDSADLGERVTVMAGASIGPDVRIGSGSVIHPGASVAAAARIGSDCVVHSNAVIGERVALGDRVVVHAGSVLGADGFGYRPGPAGLQKLEHIGSVRIGDDVEIGACVTIDRARFGNTVVGRGTKIDNLVQVAHNVRIGSDTVIAAQTGISGSTVIGDRCVVGGQAGIVDHVRIGDGSLIAARAGISKDVPDGSILYGYVATNHLEKKREEAALRRLPRLLQRVRELESRLRALEPESDTPDGGTSEKEVTC